MKLVLCLPGVENYQQIVETTASNLSPPGPAGC
jgi:hypothetical protein